MRICTVGIGNAAFGPNRPAPLWPYPLVAAIYAVAAMAIASQVAFDSIRRQKGRDRPERNGALLVRREARSKGPDEPLMELGSASAPC